MKRNSKGQFIKNTNSESYDGFAIWYDKKGYPVIWLNSKSVKLHVYIWETTNGEKPKGYDIHHKDFNKANYSLNNLELVSFSDHRRIHAGWIRENGEWVLKPCKDCKRLLPLDNFYQRKGLTPSNHCKDCSPSLFKERNTKEYKEMRKIYMREYYKENKQKWQNY